MIDTFAMSVATQSSSHRLHLRSKQVYLNISSVVNYSKYQTSDLLIKEPGTLSIDKNEVPSAIGRVAH